MIAYEQSKETLAEDLKASFIKSGDIKSTDSPETCIENTTKLIAADIAKFVGGALTGAGITYIAWGIPTNNYIPLSINGFQNNLSLYGHTHPQYLTAITNSMVITALGYTPLASSHAGDSSHLTESQKSILSAFSIVDNRLQVSLDFYSLGSISARGIGNGAGGGSGLIQSVFDSSYLGGVFSDSSIVDTFNAYTINAIHGRVVTLENGAAINILESGAGNAYTGYVKNGASLTFVKGKSFSEVGHAHSQYITGVTSNMITTALGFTPLPESHAGDISHLTEAQRAVLNVLSIVDGNLAISVSAYTEGSLASKGIGTSGGGGSSYNRLDSWADYTADKSTWVLSALLGKDLKDRPSYAITSNQISAWDSHLSRIDNPHQTTYSQIGAAAAVHNHTKSQITDFPTTWDWNALTGVPPTFNPSSHTHDDRYYTETEIGNLFAGITAISGYNKSNWDAAYANNHTHANKSLLDAFSQANVNVLSHLFIDGSGNLYTDINFYSLGSLAGRGVGSGSGGGSYNRLDAWADYTTDKSTWVLSALLGKDLDTRVTALQNATPNVTWGASTGNYTPLSINGVVKNLSIDGHTHSYDASGTASGLMSTHNSTYNHANIANGQTAFGWGNHASAGYGLASALTTHANLTTTAHGLGASAFHPDSFFALSGHTHAFSELTTKPTTLAGYGITDALFVEQVSVAQADDTWVKGYMSSRKQALVYNTYGVEWGYIFNFRYDGEYGAVLATSYSDNTLKMLTRNAGTWASSWVTFIHSGNIASQSVNYATTAGSAPASDVYAWAKAATKPSYNYSEIGGTVPTWNQNTTGTAAYADRLNVILGNECVIGNGFTGGNLYVNYRGSTAPIGTYELCDGYTGGYASIRTSGFLKSGSSDAYVLLGGGGHKAVGSLFQMNDDFVANLDTGWRANNLDYWTPGSIGKPLDYGLLMTFSHSVGWHNQLAFGVDNNMYFRQRINATDFTGASWNRLYHSGNSNLSTVDWAAKNMSISADFGFIGTTGNHWIIFPDTGTHTGRMSLQAGFGSSSAGGGISLFGQSHATQAGSVEIALTSESSIFSIVPYMANGATPVATISRTGAATFASSITATNAILSTADGTYIQIGNIRIQYDAANSALKVVGADGSAKGFYSTGILSGRGVGTSGGGSGLISSVMNSAGLGGLYSDSDNTNTFNAYTINYLYSLINTKYNYYPTTLSWTNGTTSGPIGTLTGPGVNMSFPAIPAATDSMSGVVTTGTQTFGGRKTFLMAYTDSDYALPSVANTSCSFRMMSSSGIPILVGKNAAGAGMSFISLSSQSNTQGADMFFGVRELGGLDFTGDLTKKAFRFARYSTELFAIQRNGVFIKGIDAAPASITDTGVVGEMRFTSTGIFFCIAANTWRKATLSTF